MSVQWSDKQQAVFDFVERGTGSAVVIAVAGAGKSTTICEAAWRIPEAQNVLMLAFNKSAADNLKAQPTADPVTGIVPRAKLPPHAEPRTFHSLGLGALFAYGRSCKLNVDIQSSKMFDMLQMMTVPATSSDRQRLEDRFAGTAMYQWLAKNSTTRIPSEISRHAGAAICKLVSLAKQYAVGVLEEDTDAWWDWACDNFEIEADVEEIEPAHFIGFARALFKGSERAFRQLGICDFDDQIYLPIKLDLRLRQYDWVFVDEAQDTNPARRMLARKALRTSGRLVAVGDPHQAIYGFTGANSDAMELIKREFRCAELPLTVSYRCPVNVVNAAREFVSHIEPAALAPAGSVAQLGELALAELRPTDAVLCRFNAPLIQLAYRMLSERRGVRIIGRDIGDGLMKFVAKIAGKKAPDIDTFLERLDAWRLREIEKATAKGNDSKLDAIEDRYACVKTLADALPENKRTVAAIREAIDSMFTNAADVTTLSTVHRAKGGEWPRVFIIGRSEMPSKRATRDWQQQQEINLLYVAYTRAQDALFLVP